MQESFSNVRYVYRDDQHDCALSALCLRHITVGRTLTRQLLIIFVYFSVEHCRISTT